MNDLNKYSIKKYSNRSFSPKLNKKSNSKRNSNSLLNNNNNLKKESGSSR